MKRVAIVRDGRVMNIVQGDVAPALMDGATAIDVTDMNVGVGDAYGGGSTFTAPPKPKIITWQAFMNRLTTEEAIDVEMASTDNPAGEQDERRQQAAIRVFLRRYEAAGKIDLGRGAVRNLINLLESDGVIAAGRATEILNNPIGDHERP